MSLRQQATAGVKWSGAAAIAMTGLRLTQTAVLAHILLPEDFGLMAMVMLVLGLVQAYADMGVSNAIIHRQDTTPDQLTSLYWLNVLAGMVMFILATALAPFAAGFFGESRLHDLMVWAALMFMITPFGQQFHILLQKNMRFRALAVIEVFSLVVATIASIALALTGHGVYALIWGQLTAVVVSTLSLLSIGLREWRPGLRLKREDIKGYLGFGLFQMGERSINYFNTKVDQLLIGSLLGTEVLGYYSLAFDLVMLPIMRLNPIITRVAFPIFSKLQHDIERLKQGYLVALQILSLINFPIFFGLAMLAPWIVPILFGDGWLPSVILVQILSFIALLRSVANPLGSLLLAKGRADLGFYWNALLLSTQAAGVYLGAKLGGAVGVGLALLALQLLYFVGSYFFLVRKLLGPCLADYLMSLVPQFVISVAMALAIAAIMPLAGQPTIPILTAVIAGGVAVFSGLQLIFRKQQLIELKRFSQTP